ncbi:putative tRNA pseudouridine synthase Pus10 [Dimargaris xerosporica]|nr:putative tRNA pseudouridine synthase Pus10 [Dimargaris xerosporica]
MTLDKVLAQLKRLTGDELKQAGLFPPPLVSEPCTLHDVGFSHGSLYLAGQYNKYARDISQTPFAADGRQLAQTSVSEIIGQPAQLVFKADEVKFVASGREDMDVRMLGNGRPFYLELLNPKQTVVTAKALDDLAKAINQTEQMVGCRADLLALGVVTVDLQWPPKFYEATEPQQPPRLKTVTLNNKHPTL